MEEEMSANGNIGFRVKMNIERPPQELVNAFINIPTAVVCDANGRWGAMEYQIKPLNPKWRFVGTAITVRARPVDNLIVSKAMAIAKPGDVLVVTNDKNTSTSVFGDHVAAIAKASGIVALVTDGIVRDRVGMLEVDLPVFCRGVRPNAPFKDGPGEINFPIACGDIPVHPGDIVIGDGDGVVIVPKADARAVAEKS
jgi:regulator of RNase E activity RraA